MHNPCEALQPSDDEERYINRRQFLIAACAGLLTASTFAGDMYTKGLPAEAQTDEFERVYDNHETDISLDSIDRLYLARLLNGFTRHGNNTERSVEAANKSLRLLSMEVGVERTQDYATAFEIDESGIYLTASHAAIFVDSEIFPQPQMSIVNPETGDESKVKVSIKHPKADIAVVYAPTGQPSAPTQNLTMNLSEIHDNTQLWMVGLIPTSKNIYYETYRTGFVDKSIQLSDIVEVEEYLPGYIRESGSLIAVRGLIPVGGTSGSPILNSCGSIVGVESGTFPNARSVSEYQGAMIVPLSYLDTIASQPAISY